MMFVFLISLVKFTQQCASIAEYSFSGISTTTVSSSINTATAPVLNFPSSINSANTAKDPTVTAYGLVFTLGQYLSIPSIWSQNTNACTEINFWLYYNTGVIGQFAAVSIQNTNGIAKYLELKGNCLQDNDLLGEGTSSSLSFNLYFGGTSYNAGNITHGWNSIACGICTDYMQANVFQYTVNGYAISSYLPGVGNYVISNSLYLGCMSCTDSTMKYIIHSLKVSSSNSSCVFNPLSNAMYNVYSSCGDGKINSTDTCDDYNLVSGDGCSDTCKTEPNYRCYVYSTYLYQDCELCGNGLRKIYEYCDDGNNINGDGCNSTCYVESGWLCSGGGSASKDTCTEYCGDARRFNTNITYCDDGNTWSGDGCSSSCVIESGWTCSGGTTTLRDVCIEVCGDGKKFSSNSTFCDDGNNVSGDGCSSTCVKETGWICSGGSSISKDTCTDICADGKKYTTLATFCDDGNTINSDGCSSSCSIETGWSCSGGSSTTKDTCSEICGDGIRFNIILTYCDDGNKASGDGCSSACVKETGWLCSGGSTSAKDACTEICGDGLKFNSLTTYCDDANSLNGDGCSLACAVESGWSCTGGGSTTKDTCTEICGDGIRFNTLSTYCDDGNTNNGDGCSNICAIESGWRCSGGTSTTKDACTEICGDGKRFNILTTYCDDGNIANSDGCNSACSVESGWTCSGGNSATKDTCTEICGDGIRFNTVSSYCDDANIINNDGCNSACSVESGWSCLGGSTSIKDTCTELCGDGKRFNSIATYCDDGNSLNGDGCSSACAKESGWTCSGGTTITKDVCVEVCGDGRRYNSINTYCDDGNTAIGDGCNAMCAVESGWTCSGGSSTAPDICKETCGDGKRMNSIITYCDDGNNSNGDGCSSTCSIESGWTCSGGTLTTVDICKEICGDGKRFNSLSTYCDDGNTVSGDGCSSTCAVEATWSCSGGSSTTKDTCIELCGDGKRFNTLSMYCDDGNTANNDGCSSTCSIESGWTCTGGSSTIADHCTEVCGDGKRFSSMSTYCDDGNLVNGDGCSSTCAIETGWTCSGGTTATKDVCIDICGDGKKYGSLNTSCDDGNTNNGDGCSMTCSVETGWTCSGGSSTSKDTCTEICGDGKRFNSNSTYCDDGNTINGDGCSSLCTKETGWTCSGGTSTSKDICNDICGDGKKYTSLSTFCDDGNTVNNDGCNSVCAVESGWTCTGGTSTTKDMCSEICGDAKRFNSIATYCDDGNIISNDGCSSICQIESGWNCFGGTSTSKDNCNDICGDGKKYSSASTFCDDGNVLSGDGCSSSCLKETGWACSGGTTTTADTCVEICGDGIKFNVFPTYCDDGNTSSNDGCSSTCTKELGWNCSGGSSTTKDICTEICGDGKRYNSNSTYCDDSNTFNGDGCSSTCSKESGWTCTGGSTSSKDTCSEICGDGIRFNSLTTYCDDGNLISGDGCSSTCGVEIGFTCAGGSSTSKDTCYEKCGDGIKYTLLSSYCDDGNTVSGDGCSSTCATESKWFCFGGSPTSRDICTEVCGDGTRINTLPTYCDDANNINGDGCSSACGVEIGWKCTGGSTTTKDICSEICGDGIRFNSVSTYCDDKNTNSSDGCSSSCTIESGWLCSGGSSTTSDTCSEICGDGKRFNTNSSYCDDGNLINGDGCSSQCKTESQYKCKGGNKSSFDTCYPIYVVSSQESVASIMNQATVGVGTSVGAVASLIGMSSPVGVFAMINQFQLLLLILISGVYLSDGVKVTITGMGFSMCNFDFLKLENINIIGDIFNYLSFDQTNQSLNEIGIKSGNAFINISKLLFLFLLLVLIHILLYPIISKLRDCRKETKSRAFGEKMYRFFTFSIYIRIIIQSYLVILLSSISEIVAFIVSDTIKITSFVISIIMIIGIIAYFIICWYQIWKAHPDITLTDQIYFTEFFSGLKNKTYARLFPAVYMLQRVFCCVLLIVFANVDPMVKIIIFTIVNFISVTFMLIVRPYSSISDCLLEIVSQTLVTVFSALLIHFTTESMWSNSTGWIFIGLIMASTFISAFISMVEMFFTLRNLIKKCCKPAKVNNCEEVTKAEISHINAQVSKLRSFRSRIENPKEEYKIDLSESNPTLIHMQMDIEHPKPGLPIISRKYFQR